MVGLTWGDQKFVLTWRDWIATGSNTAVWLFQYHFQFPFSLALLVTLPISLCCFWRRLITIDSKLCFNECQRLAWMPWRQFLTHFTQHAYLENQTPFFPFLFSRCLSVRFWQVVLCAPVYVLSCFGLSHVFGHNAALILATPLMTLLFWQPSTDLPLLACCVGALWSLSAGMPWLAAILFGLAWWVKPLVGLLAPVIAWKLGAWSLVTFDLWGAYILWSLWEGFGQTQLDFLFNQAFIRRLPKLQELSTVYRAKQGQAPKTWRQWVTGDLTYRLRTVLIPSLSSLPLMVFPVLWRVPSIWAGVTGLLIMALYSNNKYYMLMLLVWFL